MDSKGSVPGEGAAPAPEICPDPDALMVRKLVEAGLLTEKVGYAVAADMVMGPDDGRKRPRSVLHSLRQHGIRNLVDIALFLARDSGVPMLPLAQFTPQRSCFTAVGRSPGDNAAALPFDELGESLLVAVLNPYDRDLQQRVMAAAGRPCVFYLVLPSHYDEALNMIGNSA